MKKLFALFFLTLTPVLFAADWQYTGAGTLLKFSKWKENPEYFYVEMFFLRTGKILQTPEEKDAFTKKNHRDFSDKMTNLSFPDSKNKGTVSLSGLVIEWTRHIYILPRGKHFQRYQQGNLTLEFSCEISKLEDAFYLNHVSVKEMRETKKDTTDFTNFEQSSIRENASLLAAWVDKCQKIEEKTKQK